jgi:hypothetical protein
VTAELVVSIGIVVIMAAIVVGGAWAAWHFGQIDEEADQARRDAHELKKQVERRNEPLPDDASYGARLRRQAERLARLRDRASRD